MDRRDLVARCVAAALVLAGGIVHLRLWLDGYRDIPDSVIGPSFMANFIASVVVAIALVLWRHWVVVVAALALVNGTLLGFALSRTDRGIFDFTERGFDPSPEAVLALVFEIGAAIVLLWLLYRVLTDDDARRSSFPSVSVSLLRRAALRDV